jgi:hypothetical protein
MRRTGLFATMLAIAITANAQQPGSSTPAQPAPPQQAGQTATSQPPPALSGHYEGVASCVNAGCHGATQPLNASPVLQNEYYTWLNRDRHAGAYNVLFNDRSARIARNMHLKKKANQEAVCLDCHSTNVPANLVSGRIDIEDGVQCEACHGPASGWRAEHTQAGWTHEQSAGRGLTDLRDLRVRAHLCDHCHIGGAEKEVDHELIASGHPLLAFELDNYTETMPSHWTRGKPTHGAPAWAVGQAMAFRDSLMNLSRHAAGDKWPEFSDMSCFNCHHSLEGSQWRQERGWPGRAGLPSWSPQHWAVLRLVIGRANPSVRAQLDDVVSDLATRVSRMNDRDGVVRSAAQGQKLIEAALPQITALTWRDDDVRTVMRTLAGDEEFLLHADVQSAEQTALALQSLGAALTRANPRLLRSPMTQAIDALFAEVQNRNTYDPNRFVVKLRAVRAAL